MNISFHAEALAEINLAISRYDAERMGLGDDLAAEIDASIQRIQQNPEAYGHASRSIRRCKIRRYPYALLYRIEREAVRVFAFSHLHRKPGYWKSRLS